jgi:hypothetical protein
MTNFELVINLFQKRYLSMKEQKTMVELVRRYESYPLSNFERLGIGVTIMFFIAMMFLFFIAPNL